jgi:hypothetical protein
VNVEESVQAFERFAKLRREIGRKLSPERCLRHENFPLSERIPDFAFPLMADGFTRELIGAVNRFFFDICQADSWVQVADTLLTMEKRIGLLYEFGEPLLELSVSRPYSLRNQFIFAATHLLYQSNELTKNHWRGALPEDDKINFRALDKVGKGWSCYPDFARTLELLNDDSFRKYTHNFRHRMQHQFGLHFGLGMVSFVKRTKTSDRTTYEFGTFSALEPKFTLTKLYEQHTRAVAVFHAYWDLVQEMISRLPEKKRTNTREAEK